MATAMIPRLVIAAWIAIFGISGVAAYALARSSGSPVAAARPGLTVGLAVNLEYYDAAGVLRAARRAHSTGARMVRDDFTWSAIERRPGRRDWRNPDRVVAGAAQAGMTVLPVLSGTPRWAARTAGTWPADPQPYARFVAAVVARYGPGGAFWRAHPRMDGRRAPRWFELGNEPYLALGVPKGPQPAEYAHAVAAATTAGRAANPAARYLLAVDTTSIGRDGERPWLSDLYAAVPDLGAHYDGVAVHPYGGSEPPDSSTPGRDDRWQTRRIERIHADLVARGAGAKPVWITEIGWSTCRQGTECVSRARQARYLARVFDLASTRWSPWVAAVFVYQLEDYRARPGDKEGSFGVGEINGMPKPAWRVLQAVTRRR
jgi:hypothetical protein